MKRVRALTLLAVLAVFAPALPLHAQSATPPAGGEDDAKPPRLPSVEVSARKWTEPLVDVPESVTVIPESLILDAGMKSVLDASIYVPNLHLVEFSARRLSFPFVRGIGSGQGDPAVATYVDGAPRLTIGSTNLPLLNVERIEFLRGPQGTLYGRNALGGLIHVITRKPAAVPDLDLGATLGSYDLREMRFVAGAPIVTDRLLAGLAGLYVARDGYTKNDFTGNHVDSRDTLFGQAQLLFTPDGENEVRLSVLGERTRDGGFALSDLDGLRDRPHRIDQDYEGDTGRDVLSPALTWNRFGESVSITSISSFERLEITETADFDFSTLDGVRRSTGETLDSFSQELRFTSSPGADLTVGEGARVRWLAGVFAFTADSERSAANDYRPGGVGIITPVAGTDESCGRFDDWGIAVFGQATLTLDDRLEIGVGLRYDYESNDADLRRTFESGGFETPLSSQSLSESHDEFLPRFDLAYHFDGEVTVYGLAAKSFKAGGFNLDAPPGQIPFDPETSWTYEFGVKAELLDDRLKVNAAVFFIDWDDMQLSRFDAAVGGYVTNAGRSKSRGFELELAGRPIDGLDLFATFGATDAEFDSYVDPYGVEVGGKNLPFAPQTTWSAGAQWFGDLGGGLAYHLLGEYSAVGTFYYDAANRESERYGLANFRAGVGGENWSVEAWIKNAFGEDYVPVAFQPNPADPDAFVGESGAPRTFGVTLRVSF